jgi:hypothetical protein
MKSQEESKRGGGFVQNQNRGVRPAIFAISDLIVWVALRVLHCFSKPMVLALTSDLAEGITMSSKSRDLRVCI